jgi:S1-C subfamily serine protease
VLLFCTFSTTLFSDEHTKKKHIDSTISTADKNLHRQCIYPTIKITNAEEKGGGSGFIVRSTKVDNKWHNTVISAAHVIEEEPNLFACVAHYTNWSEVKCYKKYPFITYASHTKNDIAVGYFISEEKMPVAKMNFDTKLYINTEILHCGYGLLDDARIDYGQITQPKASFPFNNAIRTNCYTFFGDSGGPLFLKNSNEVIGVCHAIRMHRGMVLPQISYYRPITDLKVWDKQLNNALESVYKESSSLPVTPFIKLGLRDYEYKMPE